MRLHHGILATLVATIGLYSTVIIATQADDREREALVALIKKVEAESEAQAETMALLHKETTRHFDAALTRYRTLDAAYQSAVAADQADIEALAAWAKISLLRTLDPEVAYADLDEVVEGATNKARDDQVCKLPRAAEAGDRMAKIAMNELAPMARAYDERAKGLSLPASYSGFVARISTTAKELTEQARLASAATANLPTLDARPQICRDLATLADLASSAKLLSPYRPMSLAPPLQFAATGGIEPCVSSLLCSRLPPLQAPRPSPRRNAVTP